MFIARNLPKYPQYLLFASSALTKVLTGLCHYPGDDLFEDAQLSAEYLLSVYQPPDISNLIPLFKEASFYRILKRIYRADKQYGKFVQTYFEDPDDRDAIFDCIKTCLSPQTGLTRRQVQDVHNVLREHSEELVQLDAQRAAQTIAESAPDLHCHILDSVSAEPELQYSYLKTILEPEPGSPLDKSPEIDMVELYLQLMCTFDPAHVSDYVGLVQSANLKLENLLPTMEETGVIDAAVILMAKEGQVQDAMGRLTKHLGTLESALHGMLVGVESQENGASLQGSAEELMQALQKYTLVGIWLCQGQTKTVRDGGGARRRRKSPKDALSPDEELWLDLIDKTVQITKQISADLQACDARQNTIVPNGDVHDEEESDGALNTDKLLTLLRSLVQNTFTALLTSTSMPPGLSASRGAASVGANLSFLRVLRAFLTRAAASSPNLADLRAVLSSIFSAYAYEESILRLSNRLLERSLFVSVNQAVELRQRGWRPKGNTCEACGRRVWGPGVAGNVFEAWEERQAEAERQRQQKRSLLSPNGSVGHGAGMGLSSPISPGVMGEEEYGGNGKGKGRDLSPRFELDQRDFGGNGFDGVGNGSLQPGEGSSSSGQTGALSPRKSSAAQLGPLVAFACRHIYHQSCLEELQAEKGANSSMRSQVKDAEYRCPIDG
jgi:hypothetical protein